MEKKKVILTLCKSFPVTHSKAGEATDLAEKQGKRTVTNKEINAVQKEAKEAKEIAQALRKVWAYLDGGVMVDVDKLAILLDKTESLSNAMKQYKKLSK